MDDNNSSRFGYIVSSYIFVTKLGLLWDKECFKVSIIGWSIWSYYSIAESHLSGKDCVDLTACQYLDFLLKSFR